MTVVVLATDGSAHSVAAARHLLIPGVFAAPLTVHLVHAHPKLVGRPRATVSRELMDEWLDEAATRAFAEVRPLLDDARIAVTEHRLLGEAAPMIVELAQRTGASMIVMGTHGRSALMSVVMGSVATQVVASSPVPVLLVPHRG